MPRNVRNFWIEATIDGQKTKLSGGPRAKDGGFELVVKMHDEGAVTKPLTISGRVLSDGSVLLEVLLDAPHAGQLEANVLGKWYRRFGSWAYRTVRG